MNKDIIKQSEIASKIYIIRGKKVMLDMDLATLYEIKTKVLKQAVKRNIKRFPEDFMFELSKNELANWRSQIVTSNIAAKMSLRRPPCAFTEHGVAMLSSILNSDRAITINIQIIKAFIKMREYILTHKDLKLKIEKLERKYKDHDEKINLIFEAIKQLLDPVKLKKEYKIGFKP